MARFRRCASRRSASPPRSSPQVLVLALSACALLPWGAQAGLYTQSDQVVLLTTSTVDSVLFNSSVAVVVEFYASWCGHCVSFAPLWKSLARDTREWKPAVDLAVIDCADSENWEVCTRFGVRGYPTLKFFHAYSSKESTGVLFQVPMRNLTTLRRHIINMVETYKDSWPPACPPLEPASQVEIDKFFETNSVEHLALVFEKADSYVGREVILDLLQFENIAVRRVLDTEEGLVSRFGVTDFPSCYLYYPDGHFTRLRLQMEGRTFFSYALQRLPGVVRSGKPPPLASDISPNNTEMQWKQFNRTRVYMADLESALHYSLRLELAAHPTISGGALTALKRYISILAKHFPGRRVVRNLLQAADTWLQSQEDPEISYKSLLAVLDNKAGTPEAVLPKGLQWVGCQGSKPHFRRYPCSMWTLFHVITVEALNSSISDAQDILQAFRGYVYYYFGCRECAAHFEHMAKESMNLVKKLSDAILWLWSRHNRVNNRLAGALSEDPHFPKVQWPPPELCPKCHSLELGDHAWNYREVLSFLQEYYSANRILLDYLEPETELLRRQRGHQVIPKENEEVTGDHTARAARDVHEDLEEGQVQEEPPQEDQEEHPGMEDNQELDADQFADPGEGGNDVTPDLPPWKKAAPEEAAARRPSIVGLRPREPREDIVDLDSFVNQHYKAKALRAALISQRARKALPRQHEGGELQDVGLQPMEPDQFSWGEKQRLQKRALTGKYTGLEEEEELDVRSQSIRGPWMSVLSLGFSRLDVSLCMLLYMLSSLCLLAMYHYFQLRVRHRRGKVALP
ncbi:sulfhydryl oxidase 1 [Scleropages formosus]|uniref:Sulfhydryl oxidase n=1 Tax=Scleropages formosus TaxID=113540 RepID=A0A8C9S6F9_SCLFO|nr:sulfhydryl oxidase 1 [Scleropages formosus]